MRRSQKRLQAEKCLKQGFKKTTTTTTIPACPLGKQLSRFACLGPSLAVLVNDFVIGSTVDPDL